MFLALFGRGVRGAVQKITVSIKIYHELIPKQQTFDERGGAPK